MSTYLTRIDPKLPSKEAEIVASYESGASIEAVAEEVGVEAGLVKSVLERASSVYRRMMKSGRVVAERFTEEDHAVVIDRILNLALSAENEAVALKASIFLHEEIVGRNAKRVENDSGGRDALIGLVNVAKLNRDFQLARQRLEEQEAPPQPKMLELKTA